MSESAAVVTVSQLLRSLEPPIDRPFDELMVQLKAAERDDETRFAGPVPRHGGT